MQRSAFHAGVSSPTRVTYRICHKTQPSYTLQFFTSSNRFPDCTRFEEAIAAAKAYDKAAVYLYGASAITNFGLEACLSGE
jgi:hypothetical protein